MNEVLIEETFLKKAISIPAVKHRLFIETYSR